MYFDWGLALGVVNALAVPLTVLTVAIVLRPLMRRRWHKQGHLNFELRN